MADQNNAIHIEDDHARAGQTPGVVRRVLAVSLGITVIAMSAVWIVPALWG